MMSRRARWRIFWLLLGILLIVISIWLRSYMSLFFLSILVIRGMR